MSSSNTGSTEAPSYAQAVAEGKGKEKADPADVSMGEDDGESSDEETGAEDEVSHSQPCL